MIDRYWSPVQLLRNSPLPTVAATSERARRRREVITRVIRPSMPVPIIMPPNVIAESTSHTVGSMPSMPPVLTSGSSRALPVFMSVAVASSRPAAESCDMIEASADPVSDSTMPGCSRRMPMSPASEPMASVHAVLKRRIIISKVIAGMTRVQGVMTNVRSMASIISPLWPACAGSLIIPTIR